MLLTFLRRDADTLRAVERPCVHVFHAADQNALFIFLCVGFGQDNADIVQQIRHGAFGIAGHIVAVEPEFQLRQIADVLAGKVNLYGCPRTLGRIGKGTAHIDDAAAVGDVQIQTSGFKRLFRVYVDQQLLRTGQIQTACVPDQVRKRAGFLLIGAGDAQRCPITACGSFSRNSDAVAAPCVPVRSAVH